jgi:hypothetical protein
MRWTTIFVMLDALGEFGIVDLCRGDVGNLQVVCYRQFFGVGAFARAGTAQYQY